MTTTMKTAFQKKLNESSLSRIWKQTEQHDSGTISGFRYAPECGNGTPYTVGENKKRNAKLKALILKAGYGVTKIKGTYVENYGQDNARDVDEESFIVVDLADSGTLKKALIKFGTQFDQDSVTFQSAGSKEGYFLISSNTCPTGYPGEGKIGVELKLGKPMFGKGGEFHSKINGRPFVFENVSSLSQNYDYSHSEIRSIMNAH